MLTAALAAGLMVAPTAAAAPAAAPRPPGHAQPAARPQAPSQVRVPALAVDESSLSLVWNKPGDYANIADYHVYQDGRLRGSASSTTGSASLSDIKAFYADPANAAQVKIVMNNFAVTGLRPDTSYRFTVRSVDRTGVESRDSAVTVQKTTPVTPVFNIVDYGAIADGSTLNTAAIQRAINAATKMIEINFMRHEKALFRWLWQIVSRAGRAASETGEPANRRRPTAQSQQG